MKRVRISPGKFVTVSTAIAEKAERVFVSGAFTRAQVQGMANAEPIGASALLGRKVISKKDRRR